MEFPVPRGGVVAQALHSSDHWALAAMKNMMISGEAAAAEVALKAHILRCSPEILAGVPKGDRMMQEIADRVDLTEAPEDAICTLVIDLMQYCERQKIDWNQDVMSRARAHFRSERADEDQNQ